MTEKIYICEECAKKLGGRLNVTSVHCLSVPCRFCTKSTNPFTIQAYIFPRDEYEPPRYFQFSYSSFISNDEFVKNLVNQSKQYENKTIQTESY